MHTALKCCPSQSLSVDESDFMSCLFESNNVLDINYTARENVMMVTHVTESIMQYSSLSIMINSIFAMQNNLSYLVVRERDIDTKHKDPRWNKVIVTIDLIAKELLQTERIHRISYFVVMDADVVVLDWDFSIRDIATAHPSAHIILSNDKFDIANTGVMIVRCSKWSLEMFRMWWEMRQDFGSDQQAFSSLYSTLQSTKISKQRIVIIPSRVLNTPYPVYASTDISTLMVLHLMGLPDEVRREVLQIALTSLCHHLSKSSFELPRRPLNITQNVLVAAVVKHRLVALMRDMDYSEKFLTFHRGAGKDTEATLEEVMSLLEHTHAKTSAFCELMAPSAVLESYFCRGGSRGPIEGLEDGGGSDVMGRACHYIVDTDIITNTDADMDSTQIISDHSGSQLLAESLLPKQVNVSGQCLAQLHATAHLFERYGDLFPQFGPPIMEQRIKVLYDMFLVSEDGHSTLKIGDQVSKRGGIGGEGGMLFLAMLLV